MLTVFAFKDLCCVESVWWSVVLIGYVWVWPTSLESGIVFESIILLSSLAWLGSTWKLQRDFRYNFYTFRSPCWYSSCDYGLLANKSYSIRASICSKLKYAQIWGIWNIVQPCVGGIQSLVESRDYQCTPQTWAHLPLVLHFRVLFSAVSMGYCLVFWHGLRYFLGLYLKFPPVYLFHQHPCLLRDLVMVHLWGWGWVASWLLFLYEVEWPLGFRFSMRLSGLLAFVSLWGWVASWRSFLSPSQRPAPTTIASLSPFPLGLCFCSTSLSKMGT